MGCENETLPSVEEVVVCDESTTSEEVRSYCSSTLHSSNFYKQGEFLDSLKVQLLQQHSLVDSKVCQKIYRSMKNLLLNKNLCITLLLHGNEFQKNKIFPIELLFNE